jgi:hypothetical protein
MQHATAFEEPAGLRIDEIDQTATGQRKITEFYLGSANVLHHSGFVFIEQGG